MIIKSNFKIAIIAMTSILFNACSPSDIGACFNADDNNVSPNQVVTFTNCSSLKVPTQQCNWSFGDGKDTIVFGNSKVQHAYKTTGQFVVKLVTGEGANLSTHTLNLSVF
jgi:hypothetical protein